MQIVQAELEGDGRAFLAHRLVGLVLHLLDDLLDARRVNAAVGDQPFDRLLGDLAAVGIEARQDDGAGRVVDDQVDAGGELERADVAALAADDASLEVVARQIDDRHGRFDGVLGGAALDGLGDVVLGAVDGRFARLGVEPLQQVGGVVARLALDLLDQQLLGLVGGQAGDALELVLLLGDELLVLPRPRRPRPSRGRRRVRSRAPSSFSSRSSVAWRSASDASRRVSVCSSGGGLLALLAGLALGLEQQLVRLFLGLEQRLLLAGLGVALGVLDEPGGLFLGAADRLGGDALAVGDPDGEHTAGRHQRDGEVGDVSEYRQHA